MRQALSLCKKLTTVHFKEIYQVVSKNFINSIGSLPIEELYIRQAGLTTEEALLLLLRPLATKFASVTFDQCGSTTRVVPYEEISQIMDQWRTQQMPAMTKLDFKNSKAIATDGFLKLTAVYCYNLKYLDLG